ncbi:MAG: hypothetical protein WD035_07735 [Balneolaceae bacterium]
MDPNRQPSHDIPGLRAGFQDVLKCDVDRVSGNPDYQLNRSIAAWPPV